MKYFVVSDVHGFYSILKTTLEEKGFDENNSFHKLIVCGDLLDRGEEAIEMQNFILRLIEKEKVILIRGNHEDLMREFIDNYEIYATYSKYALPWKDGTIATSLQLMGHSSTDFDVFLSAPNKFVEELKRTPFVHQILPKAMDFFETKNYIFVHGWIPCSLTKEEDKEGILIDCYHYDKNWRKAETWEWRKARCSQGQYLAKEFNIIEPQKIIVCGHYTCSYGHSQYEKRGEVFGPSADFSPFKAKGIIAIDACTAHSGQVNCLVIED